MKDDITYLDKCINDLEKTTKGEYLSIKKSKGLDFEEAYSGGDMKNNTNNNWSNGVYMDEYIKATREKVYGTDLSSSYENMKRDVNWTIRHIINKLAWYSIHTDHVSMYAIDNYRGYLACALEDMEKWDELFDHILNSNMLMVTTSTDSAINMGYAEMSIPSDTYMRIRDNSFLSRIVMFFRSGLSERTCGFTRSDISVIEFVVDTDPSVEFLLAHTGLASGLAEASRLTKQNAVSVDGKKISDPGMLMVTGTSVDIRVGKKRHVVVNIIQRMGYHSK